jgi:hypothetical protein
MRADKCRLTADKARSPENKAMLMNMAAMLAADRQKRLVETDKPAAGSISPLIIDARRAVVASRASPGRTS